jgi:hypothetical protein
MSKVTELVEEEASAAEAETPDEEAAPDEEAESQEVEPQTQPDPEPSGDPTAEDIKAFRAEHARHEKALRKMMGDDFDLLVECDVCGSMGYKPPDQLRTNEKYIRCETCDGAANVLTGSRDPNWYTQPCPGCGGRGFLEKMPAQPAGQPQANGEQQAAQYGTPAWMGDPNVSATPGYAAPVGG